MLKGHPRQEQNCIFLIDYYLLQLIFRLTPLTSAAKSNGKISQSKSMQHSSYLGCPLVSIQFLQKTKICLHCSHFILIKIKTNAELSYFLTTRIGATSKSVSYLKESEHQCIGFSKINFVFILTFKVQENSNCFIRKIKKIRELHGQLFFF